MTLRAVRLWGRILSVPCFSLLANSVMAPGGSLDLLAQDKLSGVVELSFLKERLCLQVVAELFRAIRVHFSKMRHSACI